MSSRWSGREGMSPYYQKLRRALGQDLLIIPSVAALIHDEHGRLLLQEKHDGSWSLPAGAIEPGESPEEAVRREVLEETGFTCGECVVVEVLGGPAFRHTYPNQDQVEYALVLFRCGVEEAGAIRDREETKSLRYFRREEMPDLALPYSLDTLFPGNPEQGIRPQYHFRNSDRGLLAWDVRKLIEAAEGLPTFELPLDEIRELDEPFWFDLEGDAPTCRKIAGHSRLIQEVDLSHPILIDPDGRVMDGMHRVCKALELGRKSIPARRLPELPEPDFAGVSPGDLPYG